MTVCVLIGPGDAGRARAEAVAAAGSAAHALAVPCPLDVPMDASVLLAGAEVPADAVRAFFASPAGQAGRKILECGADPRAARALAPETDMLIFDAAGFAALFGLAAEPDAIAPLLCVRTILSRPNQAAVVRLAGGRAAAIWAETVMLVERPVAASPPAPSLSRFGGTIAAAVARKIGPEPALEMALIAG